MAGVGRRKGKGGNNIIIFTFLKNIKKHKDHDYLNMSNRKEAVRG